MDQDLQELRRYKQQHSKVAAKVRAFESLIKSQSREAPDIGSKRELPTVGIFRNKSFCVRREPKKKSPTTTYHKFGGSNISLCGSTTSGYASTSSPEPEIVQNRKESAKTCSISTGTSSIDTAIAVIDPEDKAIEEAIFANCTTDEEDLRWSDLETPTEEDIDIHSVNNNLQESIIDCNGRIDYYQYRSEIQIFSGNGVPKRVAESVMKFQACCRGFLQRKKFIKKQEELASLRSRVAALEKKERADLTNLNHSSQIKVNLFVGDALSGHSKSTLSAERLESQGTVQLQQINKANSKSVDGFITETPADDNYEQLLNELQFARHLLKQQREDDLENFNLTKKQLEKKITEIYEEVEEERQFAEQWKRKAQRALNDLHEFKLLHDEQSNNNTILEKKIKKLENELHLLYEELEQVRLQNEMLSRERDSANAEKQRLEQTLENLQVERELRTSKSTASSVQTSRETASVSSSPRLKDDLMEKLRNQEEEIEDLSSQVEMLEASRRRLESVIEQMRKDLEQELELKDEEIDELRCSFQKKIKSLEAQLEKENEERTLLVRAKLGLEQQLSEAKDHGSPLQHQNEEYIQKLKKDLKRAKALLKDATLQLDCEKRSTTDKTLVRQLKNQLEDSEFARAAALKSKQQLEHELAEVQQQLEFALRAKSDAEERYLNSNRERGNLQSHLDDAEAELNEVVRKYKIAMDQLSVDQKTLQELTAQLSSAELERDRLRETVTELSAKLEVAKTDPQLLHAHKRLEMKIKELESKIELEQTSKTRISTQYSRLKEIFEKLQSENDARRSKEHLYIETIRRLQRQLRELRETLQGGSEKEKLEKSNFFNTKDLQLKIETLQSENVSLRKDLSRALRRIADLQNVIQEDLESDLNESLFSDTDFADDSGSDLGDAFLTDNRIPSKEASGREPMN